MRKVSTKNTEHYTWGNNCDGWHLVKNKELSIIQERVPMGCSEKRHYHSTAQQFFYVLSGIATLELEGVNHQLTPYTGIHVPAEKAHQLSNQEKEDLIFIVTSTPPSHGDRIEL